MKTKRKKKYNRKSLRKKSYNKKTFNKKNFRKKSYKKKFMKGGTINLNYVLQKLIFLSNDFKCPLTKKIMIDPVIAGDGYTYEKTAIEKYIEKEIVNVRARREAFECDSDMEKLSKDAKEKARAREAAALGLPVGASDEAIEAREEENRNAVYGEASWVGGTRSRIQERLRRLRFRNDDLINWSITSPAKGEDILTTKLIPNHTLKKAINSFNPMIEEALKHTDLKNFSASLLPPPPAPLPPPAPPPLSPPPSERRRRAAPAAFSIPTSINI